MPRQPRYFVPGYPQHVIQRGVDRQAVFFRATDYELYIRAISDASIEHECQIHAYVLMTNHTHLLITPRHARSIPLLMQSMGRNYVQTLNRKYRRTGTLWEGRYKACLIQDNRYLLACQRYIELNPVRAGLVSNPADYRYSSFRHNAFGCENSLITAHPTYLALAENDDERRAAYKALFSDCISQKLLQQIRDNTNACLVLGDDRFKDQIEKMIGHSVRPGKDGRPRNNAE